MSTIKWTTPAALVSLLTTELNSLANGSRSALSAEQDNETARNRWADFELVVTYGTAPSAGGFVSLYFVPAVDAANYTDGSDTVQPPETMFAGAFPLRAVTTAQRVAIRQAQLPPFKWKALVKNEAGQAMAATGNTVKVRTYNEEVA